MKKIILFLSLLLFSLNLYSADITLVMASFSDNTHLYYHELLKEALKADGHNLTIKAVKDIPQPRIEASLQTGVIHIHWFVQNPERDAKYIPVMVPLTKNLIAHRILFIPKGKQSEYDNIKTLDDFRKSGKVNGGGKGWYDQRVWEANNLKYYPKEGEWRELYAMVAAGNRGVDCFSRGANEIVIEAPQHPELDVEKNLVFIYNRDFRFYLSEKYKDLKPILEKALNKAKDSGLMDKLLEKYYADVYDPKKLNLNGRIKIYLKDPQ